MTTSPHSPVEPPGESTPPHPVEPEQTLEDETPEATSQENSDQNIALYVRRRRVPTLGFWVVVSVLVGLLVGLAVAWFSDVRELATLAYFAGSGVLFVSAPLALIAAIVDSVLSRKRRTTVQPSATQQPTAPEPSSPSPPSSGDTP